MLKKIAEEKLRMKKEKKSINYIINYIIRPVPPNNVVPRDLTQTALSHLFLYSLTTYVSQFLHMSRCFIYVIAVQFIFGLIYNFGTQRPAYYTFYGSAIHSPTNPSIHISTRKCIEVYCRKSKNPVYPYYGVSNDCKRR